MFTNEKDLIKKYDSEGIKAGSVDITNIVDWFMHEDKKDVYDIYDSADFPSIMNPFEAAIWRINPFKNSPVPIYFLSETQKGDDGIYWTSYLMFIKKIHPDYHFSTVVLTCNQFGKGIKMHKGDVIPIGITNNPIVKHLQEKIGNDLLRIMGEDLTLLKALLHSINLLHCKNIELVIEPLTRQQRRQKERKSGIIYKVLAIKEGDKSYRYLDHGHNGSKKALHLCRGHFRTYTDEAPLFGRVTGTFWIPAHVKGAKENGEVVKDYKVIPATGD